MSSECTLCAIGLPATKIEVGRGLSIRLTPTIEFETDEIPETAAHMNELLAAAKARDEQVHDLAAKATFAGEANPYKEPKSHDEDSDEA